MGTSSEIRAANDAAIEKPLGPWAEEQAAEVREMLKTESDLQAKALLGQITALYDTLASHSN